MRELDHWVLWKKKFEKGKFYESRYVEGKQRNGKFIDGKFVEGKFIKVELINGDLIEGKWRKPLYQINDKKAKSNDPSTWTTFSNALKCYKPKYEGIGFVFAGSGITGIDIDHCIENGQISSLAQEIINQCNSYTEKSPSGEGVHIYAHGTIPKALHTEIEMYCEGRYFTVTGDKLNEQGVEHRQDVLDRLYKEYAKEEVYEAIREVAATTELWGDPERQQNDEDQLQKAFNSMKGPKIKDLYNGNWQSYFSSQSEADQSLCEYLAYWLDEGPNRFNRIDQAFKNSKLYRAKWNGPDYKTLTINKGIDRCVQLLGKQTELEVKNMPDGELFKYLKDNPVETAKTFSVLTLIKEVWETRIKEAWEAASIKYPALNDMNLLEENPELIELEIANLIEIIGENPELMKLETVDVIEAIGKLKEPAINESIDSVIVNLFKALDKLEEPLKKEIEIELAKYLRMPQGSHVNSLTHKITTKISDPAQLDINGRGTIESKNFKLYIEGYDKLVNGANTSAVKLFNAAIMNCKKNGGPLAQIPLKEYMELRGLKDEDKARKQIKNDMEVFKAIKFEYKHKRDWLSISLYGGRSGIYKGIIEFRFTPEFYASIPEKQFMFIPQEFFTTSDKYNPHTAYFILRVSEHKRMNLGKKNENIIGVQTLIDSSPFFPKYEEIEPRYFKQLMLKPFERDMNAALSIKWDYTGAQPNDYNEFIHSNVVITWVDYPNVERLRKSKTPLKKGV